MFSRKLMIYTWRNVSWRNVRPSSKPYTLNANNVLLSIRISRNFFTSQQLLLASKKKGLKEGKKGKSYNNEEAEEEFNINERKKKFDLNKVEDKIGVAIEKLKKEYSSMRIGRANPAILDHVTVPFKDSSAPLKDIAQIIVKDPQTLLVHVHEEELLKAVDKAIKSANLNLNPMLEGKNIKVPISKMTTEYRENMIKVASKIAENAKIGIRLVRQGGMKDLKNDHMSRDEEMSLEKKLQSLIEKSIKDIDEILKIKTKEISGK